MILYESLCLLLDCDSRVEKSSRLALSHQHNLYKPLVLMEINTLLFCLQSPAHIFPLLQLAHDRSKTSTSHETRAALPDVSPFDASVASAPSGDAVIAVGTKSGVTAAGLSGKFGFFASVTVGGTGHRK